MQLRHISPRSIDWVDAMDEGSGGTGWEKLGPEERVKLRHQAQYRGRDQEQDGAEDGGISGMDDGWSEGPPSQGLASRSPSR